MKALVYHGSGRKAWEEVPDPRIIDPTDVIVAVAATICGTDLHILKSDVPAVTDGRILGHEGDNEGASGIGWILGHVIVGTRADDVRGPSPRTPCTRCPTVWPTRPRSCCPTSCPPVSRSGCAPAGSSA